MKKALRWLFDASGIPLAMMWVFDNVYLGKLAPYWFGLAMGGYWPKKVK